MKAKTITRDAMDRLVAGVEKAAWPVAATLGPRGRLIAIGKPYGVPHVTKDGATVAKSIVLEDPVENIGAQLILESSIRTNREVGDGTTTTVVIARELVRRVHLLASKSQTDIAALVRGIESTASAICEILEERAQPIEDVDSIRTVARLAANGDDKVADLVARAVDQTGKNGVIAVEEGIGLETSLETVDGVRWSRGLVHPGFVTNTRTGESELGGVRVLVVEGKVPGTREAVQAILGLSAELGSLLVVADEFEDAFVASAVANQMEGRIRVALVQSPGVGEERRKRAEDLAIWTGAQYIRERSGFRWTELSAKMLGQVDSLVSGQHQTTLTGPHGNAETVRERVESLESELAGDLSDYAADKIRERLTALGGRAAKIRVGANTDAELRELRDRVDDALCAARAAVAGGVVSGMGVAMLRASFGCSSYEDGQILAAALKAPFRQIVTNAGGSPDIATRVVERGGEWGLDEGEHGQGSKIPVPVRVETTAIRNAIAAAKMVFQVIGTIVDNPDKPE